MDTTTRDCKKCGGSGFIPRFGHVLKGICFKCNGAGKVRVKVRRDGQRSDQAKCDHILHMAYLRNMEQPTRCSRCDLPVEDWPTVVPAHWWGDHYVVFLPGIHGASRQQVVPGTDRRAAQRAVRELVSEQVPNFRIKWMNQVTA